MSDEHISREAAISHPFANGRYDFVYANKDFIQGFVSYKEWLEDLPTADVKPVAKGKWIWKPDKRWWECDQCGETTTDACMYKPRANYCPWCGADMRQNDGEQE